MSIDTAILPIIKYIHVSAGALALVVAPLAMVAYKGGSWHRRWGKVFFYAMIPVCLTAIAMGILNPESFWLAMLAIFSFHLIAMGYRSLYLKNLYKGIRPKRIDLIMHSLAGVVDGGLLIWGLAHLILEGFSQQALLFTLLGVIGSAMVLGGFLQFYRQRQDRRLWLYGHIRGFIGGYIATLMAFSAVNLTMIEPPWLRWLWPGIVGVPLIYFWIRSLRKRFAKGIRLRSFAKVRIH